MPTITLEAQNFRGLRRLSWSPSGVCALVGPNGSGKTTALSLFQFFQDAFRNGLSAAIENEGGPWQIKHLRAGSEEPVNLALSIGDLRWGLRLVIRGSSIDPRPVEQVTSGAEIVMERTAYSDRVTSSAGEFPLAGNDQRLALRVVDDAGQDRHEKLLLGPGLKLLVGAVNSFRIFRGYDLPGLRRQGSKVSGDVALYADGGNAFAVLNNWHGRREFRERFEFVRDGLRAAFPEISTEIDFEMTSTTVSVRMHLPGANPNDGVPAYFTPNGWLTGLLHLCAVAGAEPGSLVAIDEMENSLHPFAIRTLIEAFREWAEEHDLTICLATHSPVVLNEFKEEPEKVFVMEHGQEQQPVPLDKLCDPEWLRQFSLGDLYIHGDFGGQRNETGPAPVG